MRATGAEELQEEILLKKAQLRVGTTLRDKWHLESLIGVGGMGAVYRATHRNGMLGAVKLLHPERAADEAVRKRFLREGYIANKVDHPGAVRILDDDEAEGTVFLVMELLEGVTLEDKALRQGGALDADSTMLAVDQLLATLVVAHSKGIVHRDLKPANLFVTTSGLVKILDYGIAGLNEGAALARTATQTGVGMGTPAFMAPEQARGRWAEVDAQSDVWSLGATMFWLLSGTTVHDEGTVPEQLAATFMMPARPLLSIAPDIPPALAAVVDRALRLKKEDRWRDARGMRLALRGAYEEIHKKPMPSPVMPVGPPSPQAFEPRPFAAPAVEAKTAELASTLHQPSERTPERASDPGVRPTSDAPAKRAHLSSAPPAAAGKTTLSATSTLSGIIPPRRRAVVLGVIACTLAAIAFVGGGYLQSSGTPGPSEPKPDPTAPATATATATTAATSTATVTAPPKPSETTAPSANVTSADAMPSSAVSAPRASAAPAASKSPPDAGKRRAGDGGVEETIF